MIYVPEYSSSNCAYVRNDTTIRVYSSVPSLNSTISYRDYYVNSHYIYSEGTQTFSNYTTLPTCISSTNITTDFYYRNDFADILIIFIIIVIIGIYIPLKVFTRIFRRLR